MLLIPVSIAHGLHQLQMVTHDLAEKTAESWKWPQGFERPLKVRHQQRLDDRLCRPLSIFRSQFSERVTGQCTPLDHPVQITVDEASAPHNQLTRPYQDSVIQPLPYRCL